MSLAQNVASIFRGRVGAFPATELWGDEIEHLSSAAYREAQAPRWGAPNALAYRLRERLVPMPIRGCGGEGCVDGAIVYRPDDDPRVEGGRIFHALAHRQVRRYGKGSESDVWLITGEMALPWRFAVDMTLDQALERQAHAPAWLLAAQIGYARDYSWVAAG